MEPGTGLAVFGAALGSAKVLEKLLGPTADYLGEGLKEWTARRVQNATRILENAVKKLGNKIETEGAVPPRILRAVLQEGSFCDDRIATEYFGGILASSRSRVSRDDRGNSHLALITRLSSYQLRMHYIFFQILKILYDGTGLDAENINARSKMETFIPGDVFTTAMDFNAEENPSGILAHGMFGLSKENLIDETFAAGHVDVVKGHFANAPRDGIVFSPAPVGIELFLWVNGRSDLRMRDFLKVENQFESLKEITILPGAQKTKG